LKDEKEAKPAVIGEPTDFLMASQLHDAHLPSTNSEPDKPQTTKTLPLSSADEPIKEVDNKQVE